MGHPVGHGLGGHQASDNFYDMKRNPMWGIKFGGTENRIDNQAYRTTPGGPIVTVSPRFITANEIYGKVNNNDLIFVTASCRGARTSRMWDALGNRGGHFVGPDVDITSGDIANIFQYVVDLVNNGHDTAANAFLEKNSHYIVDPQKSGR